MITDRCPPPDEAIEFHELTRTIPPPIATCPGDGCHGCDACLAYEEDCDAD